MHYVVRVRLNGKDRYLAWRAGDPDTVAVDADGALIAAASVAALRGRVDDDASPDPIAAYDLDYLTALLARGAVPPRGVIDAWNLLADIDASCPGSSFEDRSSPVQRRLYNRLFFAMRLPAITRPGEHASARLGHAGRRYVARLVSRGIASLRLRLAAAEGAG